MSLVAARFISIQRAVAGAPSLRHLAGNSKHCSTLMVKTKRRSLHPTTYTHTHTHTHTGAGLLLCGPKKHVFWMIFDVLVIIYFQFFPRGDVFKQSFLGHITKGWPPFVYSF